MRSFIVAERSPASLAFLWTRTRRIPHSPKSAGRGDMGPNRSTSQSMPTPSSPQSSKLNDDDSARAQAKARLRQLVSKVNAAALPGPADLASLDGAIRDLIRLNPNPDSATSGLINGRWVLLYTVSSTTLRQAASASTYGARAGSVSGGRSSRSDETMSSGSDGGMSSGSSSNGYSSYDGSLESALSPLQLANDIAYRFFYTYVPVLAGAAVGARGAAASGPVKPRGNFQVFDTRAGKVENQARFEVGGMQFCVNVNGTAEVVKGPPGRPCQRLRAVFTSFDVVVDGQKRLSLPLSLLNPVGFVDTPYLDDEIRISVGDKGSLFIAALEAR